ncbi:hypothetical protein [Croceitalea rosinachiae]|uniref:DUF4468 domain-containing protein n=1 Tax=Croceitalea rosinachiae TaxID=3075596 RepID=A0ABU3AC43_9FLAO|nr:hypothetical protein [Croceitalea sp. F388]MDT0607748.1 hypothetical protein [Croceitalea sp. F388]
MKKNKADTSVANKPIMSRFPVFFLLLLIIFFSTKNTFGQEQPAEFYNTYFDKIMGIQNTGLYQGIVYSEKYRTINEETQFFKTSRFLSGSVNYEGQDYYDLDLKYDVYDDKVLLKLATSVGGGTLQLFSDRLNSFVIDGHNFIKILPKDTPQINLYGFYEVSMSGTYFTLFTKLTKKSFQRNDRSSIYYEFVPGKSEYVLLYDGAYHVIGSKKDVTKLFPNQKKPIDKFYNLARRLRSSDLDAFQVALMKRIGVLLSQTNNQ